MHHLPTGGQVGRAARLLVRLACDLLPRSVSRGQETVAAPRAGPRGSGVHGGRDPAHGNPAGVAETVKMQAPRRQRRPPHIPHQERRSAADPGASAVWTAAPTASSSPRPDLLRLHGLPSAPLGELRIEVPSPLWCSHWLSQSCAQTGSAPTSYTRLDDLGDALGGGFGLPSSPPCATPPNTPTLSAHRHQRAEPERGLSAFVKPAARRRRGSIWDAWCCCRLPL